MSQVSGRVVHQGHAVPRAARQGSARRMAHLRRLWHPGHRMFRHLHGAQPQSARVSENVTTEAAGQAGPFS